MGVHKIESGPGFKKIEIHSQDSTHFIIQIMFKQF